MSDRTFMWPTQVILYHLRIWAKMIVIVAICGPLLGAALGIGIVELQNHFKTQEFKKIENDTR